jgi:LuxR family maltose regulon positive regulatory protein
MPAETVAWEQRRFPSLPVEIATVRAYLAQALGDIPGTIESARRALDLLAEGDHAARAPAAALLGLAYWARGDLESAHRSLSSAMADLRAAGDDLSAIGGSHVLADIEVAQGRLREAIRTCEHALLSASEQVQPVFPGLGELHLVLSELNHERGDLAAAVRHLETFEELREQADYPLSRHRGCTVWARLEESRLRLS